MMSENHELLDKIEKLHVLQAHKDDAILLEVRRGTLSRDDQKLLEFFFLKAGYKNVAIVIVPEPGALKLSAVTDGRS